ncbi:MAG: DUF885 family protein [Sphingomonadales bacterium]|nr:DUF885 family protein [Sphingomonadales bacterium]
MSICDQPNGKDYYRFKVRQQTTTDLTPLEIFDLGVEQVSLIQTELENLLRHADFDGSARELPATSRGAISLPVV